MTETRGLHLRSETQRPVSTSGLSWQEVTWLTPLLLSCPFLLRLLPLSACVEGQAVRYLVGQDASTQHPFLEMYRFLRMLVLLARAYHSIVDGHTEQENPSGPRLQRLRGTIRASALFRT